MPQSQLIPRRLLFGNPSVSSVQLSPDGQMLAWVAPFEGVMNVWAAPAADMKAAEPVTRLKGRPIWWTHWTWDSRGLLFSRDETGDENSHLFVADVRDKTVRDLTPLPGVAARWQRLSRDLPGKIVVGLNDRDKRWHDSYLVDLATGARELLVLNDKSLANVGFDQALKPRYAAANNALGGWDYLRFRGEALEPWFSVGYEDGLGTSVSGFDAAGKRVLMGTSIGRNSSALVWRDFETDKETLIAEHPRYDISDLLQHPVTREILAASATGVRMEYIYMADEVKDDIGHLQARFAGKDVFVSSESDDMRTWVVVTDRPEEPYVWHLFDRDKRTVTRLMSSRPELESYRLHPMQAIEQKSRDGYDLVSYLTLPASVAGDRPAKPLPMVLVVHGGPWGRDSWGFNAQHQWLADRGYAVLSVNYRGSTGFGKAFVTAAEKEHARKMHDDLIDMVDWAIREGIADKDKVAITGGSYGGYASFVGATFTPGVFCCSAPVVGITNLQTLLKSMPPYWAGFAEFMYRSYGDPRTEEGKKLLAERSPIHKVDAIAKPMLIFHGQNDVRCKVAESVQIVSAMQARRIPVSFVVYPDEGHGFHKPGNRMSYIAILEAFFAKHLGGACEPMGEDLKDSSHEIRAGGEELRALGV